MRRDHSIVLTLHTYVMPPCDRSESGPVPPEVGAAVMRQPAVPQDRVACPAAELQRRSDLHGVNGVRPCRIEIGLEAARRGAAEQVVAPGAVHTFGVAAEVAVEGAMRSREQCEPAAVAVDIREAGRDAQEEPAAPA